MHWKSPWVIVLGAVLCACVDSSADSEGDASEGSGGADAGMGPGSATDADDTRSEGSDGSDGSDATVEALTACTNSLGCVDAPGDQLICDRAAGRCVQCVADPDCDDGLGCVDRACVEVERCEDSLDCQTGRVCHPGTARCVECVTASDCASDELCGGDNRCQLGCDSDKDCTPDGKLCDRLMGHCVVPTTGERGTVRDVSFDKLDLLFVVDDSASMTEEQEALRRQFPRLIEVLTSGDRDLDGVVDFPAMTDVHLGVVTSDMGTGDVTGIPSCTTTGRDGVLSTLPALDAAGCEGSYPSFLSYQAGVDDAAETANDFGCLATVGSEGCGFEQQLEAGLKALWPSTGTGITFHGGTLGHGDGANVGFLRNNPVEGLSLIGVIVVSDEEDCSTPDSRIFSTMQELDPADPLREQPLNLRCFLNADRLHGVQRYVDGLRGLRPGLEELVTFGAIVGVPADLVSEARRSTVDFANAGSRGAYYDTILNDPRMIERIDTSIADVQRRTLLPSCTTPTTRAFPPRRIVQVAQAFGENGVVASICEADFTGAMDAIIGAITRRRE